MKKIIKIQGKKGTDKPIEIFIALFVILAVAMVVLKMFSSQISEKQKDLQEASEKSNLEQVRSDITEYCDRRCTEATDESGIVTYCLSFYEGEVDIDNNKRSDNFVTTLSPGGLCEDAIYCPQVSPCGSIDVNFCKEKLCSYFQDEWGLNTTNAETRYNNSIIPGSCYDDLDNVSQKRHWYHIYDINSINCT